MRLISNRWVWLFLRCDWLHCQMWCGVSGKTGHCRTHTHTHSILDWEGLKNIMNPHVLTWVKSGSHQIIYCHNFRSHKARSKSFGLGAWWSIGHWQPYFLIWNIGRWANLVTVSQPFILLSSPEESSSGQFPQMPQLNCFELLFSLSWTFRKTNHIVDVFLCERPRLTILWDI